MDHSTNLLTHLYDTPDDNDNRDYGDDHESQRMGCSGISGVIAI